jgi:N-acetylglucosamine-6-sulfatase
MAPRSWMYSAICASLAALVMAAGPAMEEAPVHPSSASAVSAGSADSGDSADSARGRSARPNIVVVMADDMRVDELRFAPRLRRVVAAHGLSFENSFAPYPLCCPDRASFLTGQYAHNHRVLWTDKPYGYAAFDDSRTLGTALKTAGYRTGFVGKYLNGYGYMRSRVSGMPSYRYVPRGWDDWRAAIEQVRGVHGGTYNYWDIPFDVNGRVDNSHRGEYSSAVIGRTSAAMAHRFGRSTRPFFMYVNYVAPHIGGPERGDPPRRFHDRSGRQWGYDTPGRPRWVRGRFDAPVRRGAGMPRGGGPAEGDISDKPRFFRRIPEPTRRERVLMRDVTRQRAESVYVMDRNIAHLIGVLRRSGEWSNTVFMFLSDNGYFLGEHRVRTGKTRAHEPSLRVPFLVTGPGMRSPGRRYDPISVVDVAATILDLADARPPRPADGASRLPTMRRGDRGWTTAVVTEHAIPGRLPHVDGFTDRRTMIGIRTARFSLMVNRRETDELYDLAQDPLENQNVFGDVSYRPVRRALLQQWNALRNCAGQSCQAPMARDLQATPSEERSLTRRYWSAIDAVYGWR